MDGSRHPTQRNRCKPFLVDNVLLGQTFREKFADGFRQLVHRGKLRLEGQWARLQQPQELEVWLPEVTHSNWNVFIEGPPHGKSHPAQVLKYLARYMAGGPISDGRIFHDRVTFWARSKNKAAGNLPRPFELSGKEFVRRWSMHILPKGYTCSRCFGGYHNGKRKEYLHCCRELLAVTSRQPLQREHSEPTPPKCPRCKIEMDCIEQQKRPSWQQVFDRGIRAAPSIYSPMHHCRYTGASPFPYEPDG